MFEGKSACVWILTLFDNCINSIICMDLRSDQCAKSKRTKLTRCAMH